MKWFIVDRGFTAGSQREVSRGLVCGWLLTEVLPQGRKGRVRVVRYVVGGSGVLGRNLKDSYGKIRENPLNPRAIASCIQNSITLLVWPCVYRVICVARIWIDKKFTECINL